MTDITPLPDDKIFVAKDKSKHGTKQKKRNTITNVKLCDLRKKDYFSQENVRSLQVFECPICGALTNNVDIRSGRYAPRNGIETICPQAEACWHHELEIKTRWLRKPHPKSYREELEKEIDDLKKAHSKDIKNNLIGNPDLKQRKRVECTYVIGETCRHDL